MSDGKSNIRTICSYSLFLHVISPFNGSLSVPRLGLGGDAPPKHYSSGLSLREMYVVLSFVAIVI